MKLRLLYILILMLCFCSCADDNDFFVEGEKQVQQPFGSGALTFMPYIFEGDEHTAEAQTRVTDEDNVRKDDRVDAMEKMRENYIERMDVFVKRSSDTDDTPWFQEYHLGSSELEAMYVENSYGTLKTGAEYLLHANWSDANANYDPEETYDIYVTANNPATASGVHNLGELKDLETYTYNIYRYNYDNQVPVTDQDPHYYYNIMTDQNSENKRKLFLMDGCIKGWRIKGEDGTHQKFEVELRRAAAKIVVRVKFSEEYNIEVSNEELKNAPNAQTDDGVNYYINLTRMVEGVAQTVRIEASDETPVNFKEYLTYVLNREPGIPRWKYVNFGFKTADIADGDYSLSGEELVNVETYSSNFNAEKLKVTDELGQELHVANIDGTYLVTTYSYATNWSGWIDSENLKTPFLLFSFAYSKIGQSDDFAVYYYRIPVCDESQVTSLERNNIYIVDAQIGSMGSINSPLVLTEEELHIEYHVVDWTAHNFSQQATTEVIARPTKYLTVTPSAYTLQGDGVQMIDLRWYASVAVEDNQIVDIDPSTLSVTFKNYQGNTIDIKGTVNKYVRDDNGNLVTATTANTDGRRDIVIISKAGNNSTSKGEEVEIILTDDGKISISSEALQSRAVKTIQFDVKLNNTGLVQTVYIRHFPLDNIQSIDGWWASRWSTGGWQNNTVYSYDPETDWGAGNYNENDWVWEVCTLAQYNATAADDRKMEYTHYDNVTTTPPANAVNSSSTENNDEITQAVWLAGIGNNNNNRKNANSFANRINGYYATGGSQTTVTQNSSSFSGEISSSNNPTYTWDGNVLSVSGTSWGITRTYTVTGFDYYVSNHTIGGSALNRTVSIPMWKYEKYYHYEIRYTYDVPTYYRKKYNKTTSTYSEPNTGNWVDWDRDNGQTYNNSTVKYTSGNNFIAKIYYNNNIYPISVTRSGNNNNSYRYAYSRSNSQTNYGTYSTAGTYSTNNSSMAGLNNNKMYVIQVTSTSDKYVLGTPVITENKSDDKVVSPAFMIASQLGATVAFNTAADAIDHCNTYMEVGIDNTRYTGWRLPTEQEIDFIIEYQKEDAPTYQTSMVAVLTGWTYWALNGEECYTRETGEENDRKRVRCVRDLTLEELQQLNGTIQ